MKTSGQINAKRKREGLPPLNFKLFRAIIKKLEVAPTAYDQNSTARQSDNSPCGTVACIGGWADILSAPSPRSARYRANHIKLDRGGKALGVLKGNSWVDEDEEAYVLFGNAGVGNEGSWPSPYDVRLHRARTPNQRAKVAVAYLTHIIETGKVTE